MTDKILLISGHPSSASFSNALLESYRLGAVSRGATCRHIVISQLDFNPNLSEGYKNREGMNLEDDLKKSQELIAWADHIVLAYPTWWGSLPALTKGFIDRVFLPGFAYKYHKGKAFPEKLLKGKSIRLLVTMDTPKLWFNLGFRRAQYRMLRQLIFEFVGISPVRFTTFGSMRTSSEHDRIKWLKKVKHLGLKGI